MASRVPLGLFLGFVGVVIFGATLPATRLALTGFDPAFVTFARAAMAGLLAAPLLMLRARSLPRAPGVLRDLLVVVASLIFAFPLLMGTATATVPVAHAGVVLGLLPLATVAGAAALAGERPSRAFILLSLLGAGVVVAFALRNGGAGRFGFGDTLLVLSVVACGIGYPISARLARHMEAWEVISWALVLALPLTIPLTLLTFPANVAAAPALAWAGLGYVAVMSQFIGFFFWNAGLAMGGISRVSQVQLLQTFVTVGLAWPINGEAPELETVLFAAAVVGIVALGRGTKVRRAAVAP
ncbi:DMT family transporter [Roseixanthobacter pseudopolyaromaticivorans]|uniref:DMT family transporter n=1 Tax=Xanthobacteraceae TaxID=335928 RepID=UPI003728522A